MAKTTWWVHQNGLHHHHRCLHGHVLHTTTSMSVMDTNIVKVSKGFFTILRVLHRVIYFILPLLLGLLELLHVKSGGIGIKS